MTPQPDEVQGKDGRLDGNSVGSVNNEMNDGKDGSPGVETPTEEVVRGRRDRCSSPSSSRPRSQSDSTSAIVGGFSKSPDDYVNLFKAMVKFMENLAEHPEDPFRSFESWEARESDSATGTPVKSEVVQGGDNSSEAPSSPASSSSSFLDRGSDTTDEWSSMQFRLASLAGGLDEWRSRVGSDADFLHLWGPMSPPASDRVDCLKQELIGLALTFNTMLNIREVESATDSGLANLHKDFEHAFEKCAGRRAPRGRGNPGIVSLGPYQHRLQPLADLVKMLVLLNVPGFKKATSSLKRTRSGNTRPETVEGTSESDQEDHSAELIVNWGRHPAFPITSGYAALAQARVTSIPEIRRVASNEAENDECSPEPKTTFTEIMDVVRSAQNTWRSAQVETSTKTSVPSAQTPKTVIILSDSDPKYGLSDTAPPVVEEIKSKMDGTSQLAICRLADPDGLLWRSVVETSVDRQDAATAYIDSFHKMFLRLICNSVTEPQQIPAELFNEIHSMDLFVGLMFDFPRWLLRVPMSEDGGPFNKKFSKKFSSAVQSNLVGRFWASLGSILRTFQNLEEKSSSTGDGTDYDYLCWYVLCRLEMFATVEFRPSTTPDEVWGRMVDAAMDIYVRLRDLAERVRPESTVSPPAKGLVGSPIRESSPTWLKIPPAWRMPPLSIWVLFRDIDATQSQPLETDQEMFSLRPVWVYLAASNESSRDDGRSSSKRRLRGSRLIRNADLEDNYKKRGDTKPKDGAGRTSHAGSSLDKALQD